MFNRDNYYSIEHVNNKKVISNYCLIEVSKQRYPVIKVNSINNFYINAYHKDVWLLCYPDIKLPTKGNK
jgi:hypothetical protein